MSPDDEAENERRTSGGPDARRSGQSVFVKLLVLAGILALFGYLYVEYRDQLTLQSIAAKEKEFRTFQDEHPVGVFAAAFLIYVAVTGLSLPGATVLTLTYGWFFGFWPALLLVSFASTGGATVAFLLSRYLLRDTIQNKFGDRLTKFNAALEREGAFYLFTLRLIPAVPFFVINVVMGLTPIRVWTYWWVSQVGMLAGTSVYVYAGSVMPTAEKLADRGLTGTLSPQLIVAFVALGIFPLAVKKIMGRFRPAEDGDGTSIDSDPNN
ncbi:MAG: TVP38/TMEM64 family protein [Planctomycetaceae bacterium]